MSAHHSYKATVKKLPETGEVEIKSSVSATEFKAAIKDTLADLRAEVTLPGFRKGMAPEKVVREKIGEAALLAEAAEHAISHAYGHILEAEKIDAIGRPKVTITKLAEGNDLEFTLTTAIVPEVTKFDYQSIAKAENKKDFPAATVTDEELAKIQKEMPDVKREDVEARNKHLANEKRRVSMIDALAAGLDVVIPHVLVESELDRMTDQMRHDIERMGLKFEDYLKHLKKSLEEIRKEWKPEAEKRVKLDLAVAHIAKAEKIVADMKKVDEEVKHAMEHHKNVPEAQARAYFAHIFTNQAVFEYLESLK
ncbi:MAG TPA: trigger factor [Candidatus Paceibacterota bacterium]|jgi:FKBP-type peptidyl-prolyl cis-trans isomerase (trigger factor)